MHPALRTREDRYRQRQNEMKKAAIALEEAVIASRMEDIRGQEASSCDGPEDVWTWDPTPVTLSFSIEELRERYPQADLPESTEPLDPNSPAELTQETLEQALPEFIPPRYMYGTISFSLEESSESAEVSQIMDEHLRRSARFISGAQWDDPNVPAKRTDAETDLLDKLWDAISFKLQCYSHGREWDWTEEQLGIPESKYKPCSIFPLRMRYGKIIDIRDTTKLPERKPKECLEYYKGLQRTIKGQFKQGLTVGELKLPNSLKGWEYSEENPYVHKEGE